MNDGNEALEELTLLAVILQELIWRSPARKKFQVGFIADMLLVDMTTAEAISFGRRLIQEVGGSEFFSFCRLLEQAVSFYKPGGEK